MEEQKFNVGVLMIDVFDKFTHVVPTESRKEGDVASGMIECLHKMGKKPKIVYTDDEGALNKEAIQKYLKDENIEHHKTRAKFSDLLFLFTFLVFYCFCLFLCGIYQCFVVVFGVFVAFKPLCFQILGLFFVGFLLLNVFIVFYVFIYVLYNQGTCSRRGRSS